MTQQIAPQLTTLAVPIDSVRPHPRNPNSGDIGSITTSLEQFAQYAPIVVQRSTGHIVKGNHTYLAARALGWTEIAANVMDYDDTQALAVLVGDNRHSELGTRDQDELGALLTELAKADALLGTGYDGDDVDALLAELAAPDWGAALGVLPDGDKSPFEQMTFTLSTGQAQAVRGAIERSRRNGPFVDTDNENGNGNALARVCEAYVG